MTTQHLLVVEDDPDIAHLLRLDLEDAGYQVTQATSIAGGLSTFDDAHPDLMLLDLGLPDGDGRELLIRLRRHSTVPVIVLTARDAVWDKVDRM